MARERLQKIIAQAGLASRRAAESMITSGRVRVNGRVVTELGTQADPRRDRIEVDGDRITREQLVYLVLHKPRGVVSTMSDPEGRPTIAELVARVPGRVFPVGRLDFATSGVLLMTNDGELSQALLHPRQAVPKTYVVKCDGTMTEADLGRWRDGIDLDDGPTKPADVRLLRYEAGKTWLLLTLREGRNQQIRRMGEASGFPVMRLARVSFAGIEASDTLRPGQWRALSVDEQRALRKAYGVPKRVRAQPDLLLLQRHSRPLKGPRSHDGASSPAARPRHDGPAAAGSRREGVGSRDTAGARSDGPGSRAETGARRPAPGDARRRGRPTGGEPGGRARRPEPGDAGARGARPRGSRRGRGSAGGSGDR